MSKSLRLPSDNYISQQCIGKSLFYNANGTNQNFTLSDNYKKFKKIDILFGYGTWGQANYTQSFLPEKTSTACLTVIYSFTDNATMRFATCSLNFSNKNVTVDNSRSLQLDIKSTGVSGSNTNTNILIYEVIGYPN